MKHLFVMLLVVAITAGSTPRCADSQTRTTGVRKAPVVTASPLPESVAAKEIRFYSEGIQCYGKIFVRKTLDAEAKSPAVVLAPGWGETASSIEKYAAHFASRGLVAMVIDYRGWGRSGGFLQSVDPIKTDDRLRFSQMTTRVRIRRKRLLPQQQILDIRNALYYLQGEQGVDRARVGVWGTGMAGGHVIVIAATDARIKAAVAQTPIIEGRDTPRKASAFSGALLQADQKRARTGQPASVAAGAPVDLETRLAVAEYHPFWYVEQIPKTTGVLFITGERESRVNTETDAIAASKLLKGPGDVVSVPGLTHTQLTSGAGFTAAATAAADWFLKHL